MRRRRATKNPAPGPRQTQAGPSAPRVVELSAVVNEIVAIEQQFAPPGGREPRFFRDQVDEWRRREVDEELQYSIPETFGRVLFTRLCERYGLKFHRDATDPQIVCVIAPFGFAQNVLWPQYDAMGEALARFVYGHVESVFKAWLGPTR